MQGDIISKAGGKWLNENRRDVKEGAGIGGLGVWGEVWRGREGASESEWTQF